jgi:outer membrane protein insertion porin family
MRKKFGLVGLLVTVLSVSLPVSASFFAFSAVAQAATNNVVIEGTQRVDRETILSYLQFGPNEAVSSEKIDASIKTLFQTGLFSDVKISRRGNSIIIRVVENPMISTVNFEGNSEIDDETLKKEVEVRESNIYTKSKVQSDTRRILALYQSKGFYNVRVEPKLIRLADNRVNLAFEISENGKTEVTEINFVGNRSISSDKLQSAIVTKQKTWWNPFLRNSTYDADRLEYDKELIRRFYLKNGFADVQVTNAEAHLKESGDSFVLNFAIEEGPRYSVADVAVNVGSINLDAAGLRKVVKTGVGDTYDASKVDKSVENLTLEASNQGFVFAKVDPQVVRNGDAKTVNITYSISEGTRAYVERIDIVGNGRTRDEVIRRELRLYEGDAFNRTLVERARRRLTALDYFEKIDFKEQPGSSPDKVVLVVDVAEKSTGSLTFSIGYSSTEAVVGSVQYAERNMFGMGYQQSLNTSLSFKKQSVDYSFTNPYFMDTNLSAGFDIFANATDNTASSSYTSTQYGGALRTGFALDEYSSMNFKFLTAYRNISGIAGATASPAVIAQEGSTWKNALSVGYTYDDLDNPNLPTTGLRAQLQTELAGLVGDAKYAKVEAKAWYFIPLLDDQVVIKLQGTAGHIQPLGNAVNLQDKFFKGSDSFRGFAIAGLGPHQTNNAGGSDSIGAQDYAIGTVEANFPLGLPEALGISGAVFSDFGTVFNAGDVPLRGGTGGCASADCSVFDTADFRLSVGAGIVWQSPFGPLRLDYSIPVMKANYDVTQNWRFSIGTRF